MNAHLTPEEARRMLEQAEGVNPVGGANLRRLQWFSIAVGLAMAAVLVLIKVTAPFGDLRVPTLLIGMAVYVGLIFALILQQRRATATPRGYRQVFAFGLAATSIIFCAWVAVFSTTLARDVHAVAWWLVAVAVITTALPGGVAALVLERPSSSKRRGR